MPQFVGESESVSPVPLTCLVVHILSEVNLELVRIGPPMIIAEFVFFTDMQLEPFQEFRQQLVDDINLQKSLGGDDV